MKHVQLFYLKNCPFCKKALRYIEELNAQKPEFQALDIELIEESEEAERANQFDYYYVPTLYIDGVKVHEGAIYPDEVEPLLRQALE
ncbi:MAG: thioredoxin family protein [Alistipes sp.]|nr:thioredoxin family protein [Alistipes sp.]